MAGCIGCSSLPRIAPDLTRGAPMQVQGARGPMSAVQSQAVLDGPARSNPRADIFTRHLALEEALVGSPLTTGIQVLLL